MVIAVSEIINLNNLKAYKNPFAVSDGRDEPLDVFVRDREEWKGWNSSPKGADDFSRRYIFSLIRYYHHADKWLFGGIFEVIERRPKSYKVALVDDSKEYIGRLLIHYRDPGYRGRAFYLEKHFAKLEVSQIFEETYGGEAFCGYGNISHKFSNLESIFKRNQEDSKSPLENVRGIYLIADTSNGKMYVGSAYGDEGIWARWSCYFRTGHGYNDELTKLIKSNGIGYARKNFQFSLLEFRSMKTDNKVILDRESYWKQVLRTNEFGYNKN